MKDLGLDSLDSVEIVMAFEDEFGEQSVIYCKILLHVESKYGIVNIFWR